MRRSLALLAAGLVAASTIAAGPSSANSADYSAELELGDNVTVVASGASGGLNANYHTDYACSSSPETYCETVLIKVTNPFEEENAKKGRERANLNIGFNHDVPVADFDLGLYESDADGTKGAQVGTSGNAPVVDCTDYCENVATVVTTTEDVTEAYYLLEVVYFAAGGGWTADIEFFQ